MKKYTTILGLFIILSQVKLSAQLYKNISKCDYTWNTRLNKIDVKNGVLPPTDYLLESLNNIHKGEETKYLNFLLYNDTINATTEVKQKVLSILKNEWSCNELSYYWNKREDVKKNITIDKINHLLSTTSNTSPNKDIQQRVNFIHDSLAAPYKKKLEDSINNFKINTQVILTAAWLNLKEAIPILQQAKTQKNNNYDNYYTTIALAKLGNKEALNEIYDWVKEYNNKNMHYDPYQIDIDFPISFIGTQESIYNMINLIDTTKKSDVLFSADAPPVKVYSSASAAIKIYYMIKNEDFRKIYSTFSIDDPYIYGDRNIKAPLLIKIKEWLIANKGKYILDFNYMFANITNNFNN